MRTPVHFENEREMNRLLIEMFGGNRVLGNNIKLLQNNVVSRLKGHNCNICVNGLGKNDETAIKS